MKRNNVKNIIISGTNFWNPGDDFVRDGIVNILKTLHPDHILNFLFYNFNADYFPLQKFAGISNALLKGDLNRYSRDIDAVVIAGLSAGHEIKDLYRWIIENDLTDRIYMIGAGYENDYVANHIVQEPEFAIFRSAKIITGRTRKAPQLIKDLHLPYVHLHCPAVLSAPHVKEIASSKSIEKICFSIQLPHGVGVANHSCAESIYKLAVDLLIELSHRYDVSVIAHHKSEYFHFLETLREFDIAVIFSSFYQDYYTLYPQHDLFVTTRLHCSIFANSNGIPGIIVNDTDRHTHCLEGFPHSTWVNSREHFYQAFSKIQNTNLRQISEESDRFKKNLMQKYRDILAGPFGINPENEITMIPEPCKSVNNTLSPESHSPNIQASQKETLKNSVLKSLTEVSVKKRVLSWISALEQDYWLTKNIEKYEAVQAAESGWFEAIVVLNWFAHHFKPVHYLEIGVRRGRSLVQVLGESPATKAYGFDMWIKDYGSIARQNIHTTNPGPEFVLSELKKLHIRSEPVLIKGNSHETLASFFADSTNPRYFDLINVDGDHTYDGAKLDVDIAFEHLAPGGALVFDDIHHHAHPELRKLWNEYKEKYPDYIFIEDVHGTGTGVAFKPPFTKLAYLEKDDEKYGGLPIHFFTIVLNGEPFIRHHIEVLKHLRLKWHWHIVEGVADLKHDTAWSLRQGGKITDELHRNGLSNDGTTEYLDEIAGQFPDAITIYRKQGGAFWDGKLEMVNAPLKNINEECLLWQIDADELWTAEQIGAGHLMFVQYPEKTAAYYFCHYFVGEDLVITTRDTYGNNTGYEWLRTWKYRPGDTWFAHEPPRLCRQTDNGQWADLASSAPLSHRETENRRLVFQHYAYATESQLFFKERYFGYAGAINQWRHLQQQTEFPVLLKDYFAWVKDLAQVNTVMAAGILPIARKNILGQWRFRQFEVAPNEHQNILWVRTDSIGDNILAASMIPYIREKYGHARITVLCQSHIAELYEACPYVDNIITFNRVRSFQDERYRNDILQKIQTVNADLVLNSVYSREPLNDFFAIGSTVKERIALYGNLSNTDAESRDWHNQFYTQLLPSDGEHKTELERHKDFLKGIGIAASRLEPVVWLTSEDELFADNFFRQNRLNPEQTIALFAGVQNNVRLYDHYGSAIAQLCRNNQFSVVALGAKSDYAINQRNLDATGVRTVNLSGETTLRQTAAIVRRCRLAVGAETGIAHIACAVGTPNVIVLGGGHFGRFMPYSPLTSIVCLPLECYYCSWLCKYQRVHCVRDISPDVLREAVHQTLNTGSPKPRIFLQGESLWSPQPGQPQWKWFPHLLDVSAVDIIPIGTFTDLPSAESAKHDAVKKTGKKTSIKGKAKISPHSPETLLIATNLVPFKDQDQADRQNLCIESVFDIISMDIVPLNICYPDELLQPSGWHVAPVLTRSAVRELKVEGKRKPFVTDLFDIASDWARENSIKWFALSNSDIIFTPRLIDAVRALLDEGYETIAVSRNDVEQIDPATNTFSIRLDVKGHDIFVCQTGWWKNNRQRFQPYIFGERAWDSAFASVMACHSKFHILYSGELCYHFAHETTWRTGPYADYNMSLYNGPDKHYADKYAAFMNDIAHVITATQQTTLSFEETSALIKKHFQSGINISPSGVERSNRDLCESESVAIQKAYDELPPSGSIMQEKKTPAAPSDEIMRYVHQADAFIAKNDIASARETLQRALPLAAGNSQLCNVLSTILANLQSPKAAAQFLRTKGKIG